MLAKVNYHVPVVAARANNMILVKKKGPGLPVPDVMVGAQYHVLDVEELVRYT